MEKPDNVPPFTIEPENGGSLQPLILEDVQNIAEVQGRDLERFERLLQEALARKYSFSAVLRKAELRNIMKIVKVQPFPEFLHTKFDQLLGIFGPTSAQAFAAAVKKMKE